MPGELLYRITPPRSETTLPIPSVNAERTTTGTAADLLPEGVSSLSQTTTTFPSSPGSLSGTVNTATEYGAQTTLQDRIDTVNAQINAQIGGFGLPSQPEWEEVPLNTIPGGEGTTPHSSGIRVFEDAANPGRYQVTDPDWQEPRVFGKVHHMEVNDQDELVVSYTDRQESGSGNVRSFAQEEGVEIISLDGNERDRWIEESRVGIEIQF